MEKIKLFSMIDVENSDALKIIALIKDLIRQKEYFFFTTSGSTGDPKQISISYTQIAASVELTKNALQLSKSYTSLICLNTDYIAGAMMVARSVLLDMKSLLVKASADPLENLNSRFDFAAFVPLQLYTMLTGTKKDERLALLNLCQVIIIGGSSITKELELLIHQITCPVYLTYGMTETVSHIALKKMNGADRELNFKTLPSVAIRLDRRGCLEIKSPTTGNQWITTNDLAELHTSETFSILGRVDRVVISGGVKIQVETIEKAIENIQVEQKKVFSFFLDSVPDPELGQKLVLYLAKSREVSDDFVKQLNSNLNTNLPKYFRPKEIIILNHFYYTPTQKIDRIKTLKVGNAVTINE